MGQATPPAQQGGAPGQPSPFQSPFQPGESPFQAGQPAAHQAPAPASPEGHGASDPRVQDLQNKGFRPLSTLPGGQVPSAAPGLTGSPNGTNGSHGANGGSSGSPFDQMPSPPASSPFQQEPASAPPSESPASNSAFASPFEVQPESAPPEQPAASNPFAAAGSAPENPLPPLESMSPAAQTPAAPPSPFEISGPQPGQSASVPEPAPNSPFEASSAPAAQASPFEQAQPPSAPAPDPEPAPAQQQQPVESPFGMESAPAEADAGDEFVELSLKDVLLNVPQDRLGFDAMKIPDEVTAEFSMRKIKPQLSTGRVVLKLQDVIDGCQERFQPAFAKADRETSVALPMESLFHQLPTDEPAPKAEPETPAQPANPFSTEAAAPAAPASNPFELAAAPAEQKPEQPANQWPAAPQAQPESHSAFLPDGPETELEAQAPTAPAEPQPQMPENPFSAMNPATGANEPMPGVIPPHENPALSPFGMPPSQQSAPSPASQWDAPLPTPAPAPEATPSATESDDQQLQLRALLMVSGRLDAEKVISLCEDLPGIDACCLLSENGELHASSINSGEFAARAQQTAAGLGKVSDGLGVGDSSTFTLRAGSTTVTFFKASPVYVGVQHSDSEFQPGVREKLTLISRELARMIQ